jgi:hypothetical protein
MTSLLSRRLLIINTGRAEVTVIMQLLLLLVFLLQFPDGTLGADEDITNTNTMITTPTCQKLKEDENFYFPNDCVTKCSDKNDVFDTKRSRNVNGDIKCFCINDSIPICTDDPFCSDLLIFPGTVYDNCFNNCDMITDEKDDIIRDNDVIITDEIEYATFSEQAANKNQTHYKVSCSCDGGITTLCGIDYILFSDLTYLPSCTNSSNPVNNLNINSKTECTEYCTGDITANNIGAFAAAESEWSIYESSSSPEQQYACGCVDKNGNGNIAVACDDTKANYNDGSGLGTKNCYESVGISTVDCTPDDDESSSAFTTTTTSVARTTTMKAVMMYILVELLEW